MESTVDIIIYGKEKEDDQPALHIYKYKNQWQKKRTIPVPCRHDDLKMLAVIIENNERLLVSCWDCKVVWLRDIDSWKFNEALREEGFYPKRMYKAEGDYVFIEDNVFGSKNILKVKCLPTGLTVDKSKIVHYKMDIINAMCYLPDVECIAFSSWLDHIVKAIHCETGQEV